MKQVILKVLAVIIFTLSLFIVFSTQAKAYYSCFYSSCSSSGFRTNQRCSLPCDNDWNECWGNYSTCCTSSPQTISPCGCDGEYAWITYYCGAEGDMHWGVCTPPDSCNITCHNEYGSCQCPNGSSSGWRSCTRPCSDGTYQSCSAQACTCDVIPPPTCTLTYANNDPDVCYDARLSGGYSQCNNVDGSLNGIICAPVTGSDGVIRRPTCIPGSERKQDGSECKAKCYCSAPAADPPNCEVTDTCVPCHTYGQCIYSSTLGNCYQNWECVQTVGDLNVYTYEIRQCAGTGTVDGQVCTSDGGGTGTPACSVTLTPASSSIAKGTTTTLTANITITEGAVENVSFVSSDIAVASVSPLSEVPLYTTVVTGINGGSVTVTADVNMSGAVYCSDTASVTVSSGSWWQVGDSDVTTNGNITSNVPLGLYFGLDGPGGFPGVAAYGGSMSTLPGGISSLGWNANTTNATSKIFDYAFFARQLPEELFIDSDYLLSSTVSASTLLSGGYLYQGIYFYRYDGAAGDLTFGDNISLGARKVAVLVKGADVLLNGTVSLTDGEGFLALIVGAGETGGGNIYISPALGGASFALEGIYLAEESIYTGTVGVDSDTPLQTRGSVVGLAGISLQRDLADDSATPAEYFEYAPDQIMILLNTPALSAKKMSWKEVAP